MTFLNPDTRFQHCVKGTGHGIVLVAVTLALVALILLVINVVFVAFAKDGYFLYYQITNDFTLMKLTWVIPVIAASLTGNIVLLLNGKRVITFIKQGAHFAQKNCDKMLEHYHIAYYGHSSTS